MGAVADDIGGVIEAFRGAAVSGDGWNEALEGLATLTGSRCAEIVGLGSALAPFHLICNGDPEAHANLLEIGGYAPALNRRVRVGARADPMRVLTTAEFMRESDLRSSVHRLFERYDVPHAVQTTLMNTGGALLGLGLLRTRRQGEAGTETLRAFQHVAPHVRAAISLRRTLEHQGAALMAGALDQVGLAAFVCDRSGRVSARSDAAEALLAEDGRLYVRDRELRARDPAFSATLAARIAQVCRSRDLASEPPATFAAPGDADAAPLVVEIASPPRRGHGFDFEPGALVIVRAPRDRHGRAALLARALFGLTLAESVIAADLVEGLGAEAIAARRRISPSTVRTHIKHVLAKADVPRQLELVARISARL